LKKSQNQEKIIGLIEKQEQKVVMLQFGGTMTEELEDHFTSNFPLQSLDKISKLEELLATQQYYKLLVRKSVFIILFSITTQLLYQLCNYFKK